MNEAQFEKALIDSLCHGPIVTHTSNHQSFPILRTRNWDYEPSIKTTAQLWENFRRILYQHNQDKLDGPLSDAEFSQVRAEISNLTTPFKAGQFLYGLNGISQVKVDLDNGKTAYLTVFDQSQIGAGNTVYQVVNQIERPPVLNGRQKRRFDVTLLINGLPIIQIELKTGKVDVRDALNQMEQYAEEEQYSDIFSTVQILVALSENNIRYMANTPAQKFNKDFAFPWQRFNDSSVVYNWKEFADSFLSIPMAHKMATNYMVLDGTPNKEALKVMRPYQVAATERVLDAVKRNTFQDGIEKLGYVWHTTGSGKTITSFKTAWLSSRMPNVDKVVFVVDRIALTDQTRDDYRAYDPEATEEASSIADTTSTKALNRLLKKKNNDIIVTSVQKLERLISSRNFEAPKKNFLFIVDEAHRSTGGDSFEKVQKAFKNSAWIGYTGTPDFDGTEIKKNTASIFGKCLHTYTIKEAIKDRNVLGFNVEFHTTIPEDEMKNKYLPQFYRRDHPEWSESQIQNKIANLTPEDMDDTVGSSFYDYNEDHVQAVVEDIMKNWRNRSVDGKYNAMLTTKAGGSNPSSKMAMQYFDAFQRANEENKYGVQLKVAVTFSQDTTNKDNMKETNSALLRAILAYNQMFGTSFDASTTKEYMKDVQDRLKRASGDGKYLDLVIVVDQLLTGFNAPELNTLYVDRMLKGSGLVQAYSRTNRIQDMQDKPYGNIVNYRWPAQSEALMSQALAIYSNQDLADGDPNEVPPIVLADPFETVLADVNDTLDRMRELTNDIQKVPDSETEREELLRLFRQFHGGIAKLKQYPAEYDEESPNGAVISGYDYNRPDDLLRMLNLTSESNQMLNVTILNGLKKVIGGQKGIPPIQVDVRVEHIKDIVVDYDWLSRQLGILLKAVHDNDMETAKEAEQEIQKFADGLEDRSYAGNVMNAAKAIIGRLFPPKNYKLQYPFVIQNTEFNVHDIIADANTMTINKLLLDFRNKWGITDIITGEELKRLFSTHTYGQHDLDISLKPVYKEAQNVYQVMASDEKVRAISKKIIYRNSLQQAVYQLADSLIEREAS